MTELTTEFNQDWQQPGDPLYREIGCIPQPMFTVKGESEAYMTASSARWTPIMGWVES